MKIDELSVGDRVIFRPLPAVKEFAVVEVVVPEDDLVVLRRSTDTLIEVAPRAIVKRLGEPSHRFLNRENLCSYCRWQRLRAWGTFCNLKQISRPKADECSCFASKTASKWSNRKR